MDKLIYLATPYNHLDPRIREDRFILACIAAGRLMREGTYLFCPIAQTHPIALQCNLPHDWEYWREYDRLMLNACAEMWIVQMEGWQESKGIAGEIKIAIEQNKPIRYLHPVTLEEIK